MKTRKKRKTSDLGGMHHFLSGTCPKQSDDPPISGHQRKRTQEREALDKPEYFTAMEYQYLRINSSLCLQTEKTFLILKFDNKTLVKDFIMNEAYSKQ
ncbi:hypothetical protein CEXT_389221 [Caerostris extrusa]|uniref:Uncharacterized protein n=1 Tax=Caerostris extrusa TaxID=172846 RepID=A0AAV4PK80_CAEEX|nr:hypothetical protein CEXT_389221 [Caerostris extrusa]